MSMGSSSNRYLFSDLPNDGLALVRARLLCTSRYDLFSKIAALALIPSIPTTCTLMDREEDSDAPVDFYSKTNLYLAYCTCPYK